MEVEQPVPVLRGCVVKQKGKKVKLDAKVHRLQISGLTVSTEKHRYRRREAKSGAKE